MQEITHVSKLEQTVDACGTPCNALFTAASAERTSFGLFNTEVEPVSLVTIDLPTVFSEAYLSSLGSVRFAPGVVGSEAGGARVFNDFVHAGQIEQTAIMTSRMILLFLPDASRNLVYWVRRRFMCGDLLQCFWQW